MTFIIFHYSVAVDTGSTGFYDVIIMKSLSLSMNLTIDSVVIDFNTSSTICDSVCIIIQYVSC